MAKRLDMPKSLIQAILLREITCIYALDAAVDLAVMNYFEYQRQIEAYMKAPWYSQLFMNITAPIPMRDDSSTGLGQIQAKTAVTANNHAVANKYIVGVKYSYSNWKHRKTVWYKLKDDNEHNVGMVGLVLKDIANEKRIETKNLSVQNSKKVLARYNGTKTAATRYGKLVYRYYKLFRQYN